MQISEENGWQVTADRYVGFIDIMGFKNLVAHSIHEEIYDMMQEIEHVIKSNENMTWGNEGKMLKSTFFSDSIVLYSKDGSRASARAIGLALSSLSSDLILRGVPHKGALAFGKMTLDYEKSIFFGQPLIDAYLLQEELLMYGVVVHSSAERELEKLKTENYFLFDHLCPFKGGSSHHYTIPPMDVWNVSTFSFEEQKWLTKEVKKFRHRTSGHTRKYIDNTETFLKTFIEFENNKKQL